MISGVRVNLVYYTTRLMMGRQDQANSMLKVQQVVKAGVYVAGVDKQDYKMCFLYIGGLKEQLCRQGPITSAVRCFISGQAKYGMATFGHPGQARKREWWKGAGGAEISSHHCWQKRQLKGDLLVAGESQKRKEENKNVKQASAFGLLIIHVWIVVIL